jgi:CBS-domain-containing membrane protein
MSNKSYALEWFVIAKRNLETLLQNPVLNALIRRKASVKTALILCSNLLKEDSHTPLYTSFYLQY